MRTRLRSCQISKGKETDRLKVGVQKEGSSIRK